MEPKNALGRQYKKLFSMNNVSICAHVDDFGFGKAVLLNLCFQVKLHFTDAALCLIAKKSMAKNTGARGLRAILETVLLEAMYEVL